jgi:antitoxin component YwqK of YwqJK toxin-antitoxin module
MKSKIITILIMIALSVSAACQTDMDLNKTDAKGRKKGHWIKKNPDGKIQYEGTFKDDHPVGEFKRYFEDNTLKSLLVYSSDGREAYATIYHPNGFIASQGKYINQLKEGKWKFYSQYVNGYLINEEEYSNNTRNGPSLKYFPDSTIAEKLNYTNGIKDREWLQYFANGQVYLKAFYSGGMLNGKFEVWFSDGKQEVSGTYKNNLREGKWLIYKEDGTLQYEINYVSGITNDHQMDIDATNFIDSLEKNKDKIADPEKTGVLR